MFFFFLSYSYGIFYTTFKFRPNFSIDIFFNEFCAFIKEKNAIQEELLLRTFAI